MQNAEPVQLRQVRDFGQIFNATFTFLRQNWKPLFRAIGAVGLPAGLVGGFLSGGAMAGLQQLQMEPGEDPGRVFSLLGSSMAGLVPGMIILFAAWMVVVSMVHEYIRAYHQGEHHLLGTGELVKRGLSQMGPYFGASFLSGLLVGLGFMLCILPAMYPAAVLSLALAAHAIERTGGSGALSRSNQLVSGDFWPTLGLVIVATLLKWMLDYIVVLPFTIAGMVIGINTGLEAASGNGPMALPEWMGIFNSVSTAVQWCVQMVTYPIVAVAMALKYFSRVEETEGHGLKERIAGFDQA